MYLASLSCAVPARSYTQRECWEVLRQSPYAHTLSPRAMDLMERVLTGDSGIERRQFAVGPEQVFDLDAEALNRSFEREAPALASEALQAALDRAGLDAGELDALYVCTCTGYLCPGVSSHVAERLGMRPDAWLHDLVGLGCAAAIPTLRVAAQDLAANPDARVAVVAVEICSAAFYLDNDFGVLISACLFGDGAAASIWTGRKPAAPAWRAHGFDTLQIPRDRELLRFVNSRGKLRNLLDHRVPALAADAVARLYARSGNGDAPRRVIAHNGGRDVLLSIGERIPGQALAESRDVLREHGNMSSPSVFFALDHYLRGLESSAQAPEPLWMTAFGAGFSAHACRMTWEE